MATVFVIIVISPENNILIFYILKEIYFIQFWKMND